ncbi:MAG TPA: hypothetical protein VM578_00240 [Candidatus Saccharimonadales bacterium]|nr:hypothetical protein [Candidatus Saccharimonadales bacterium]
MKALLTTVFLCVAIGVPAAQAQTAPGTTRHDAAPHKSTAVAGRTECALAVELCVTVPANWQRLGDVFENLGFVVAEPHRGTDSATWPQLTVAAIDVPSAKDSNGAAPSLDTLVDLVLTPGDSFTTSETLERSRVILNGHAAEIVRVKLHDNTNKSEAVEEIALIEGEEALVYSIALRCNPDDFARLEPVFQKAAHSWQLKQLAPRTAPQSAPQPIPQHSPQSAEPAAPPAAPQSTPKQDPDKK